MISAKDTDGGIKSISTVENQTLINLEGRGLLGKVGVDARIFGCLSKEDISVGIIAQGSSERGIGFLVNTDDAERAKLALEEEFSLDYTLKDVNAIKLVKDVVVLSHYRRRPKFL